jgi:hypothetical protein
VQPRPTAADLDTQLKRIRFAISDMEQAAAGAALAVAMPPAHPSALRALWTGIVVCYARPFTSGHYGRFDRKKYAPSDPDKAALHRDLIDMRDKLWAHNDSDIRSLTPINTSGPPTLYIEQLGEPMSLTEWLAVVSLAYSQIARLKDDAAKVEAHIEAAGAVH